MRRRGLLLAAVVTGAVVGALVGAGAGGPETLGGGPDVQVLGRSVLGESGGWTATVRTGRPVPRRLLDPAGGCLPLHAWASERGAVPRGTATAAFTVAAPAGRALLVRGVKVIRGKRLPLPEGRDVACSETGGSALGYGMRLRAEQSLDGTPTGRPLSQYVRPGGTTGGFVRVRTHSCSCQWWIELDVLDNGKPRKLRIDDGGRPFTLAPPAPPVATDADREVWQYGGGNIPLAGQPHNGTVGDHRLSARGLWLTPGSQAPWQLTTDHEVPAVRRIAGTLDVPGVPCVRMYRTLVAAGGRHTGHSTFLAQVASRTEQSLTADVRLHIEKVEPRRGGTGYACLADNWQQDMDRKRETAAVYLAGATPGTDLPVMTGTELDLARREADPVGQAPLFFGVEPGDADYSFTVRLRLTDRTGKVTEHTLSDNGRPFVVSGAPPPDGLVVYRESGNSTSLFLAH
ncbi:hypothetical protein ABT381_27180 [Streptomyces sp. NPDC000151]|uniref:hypothetical protein n=1 Tax=Streptomyces sp. NPDC000151 TaxID=3154244 RepID=UPI00331F366A